MCILIIILTCNIASERSRHQSLVLVVSLMSGVSVLGVLFPERVPYYLSSHDQGVGVMALTLVLVILSLLDQGKLA